MPASLLIRAAYIVALLAAMCNGARAAPSRAFVGKVVSVHDGDTITVLDSANRQHKIRLAAIDAPELHQAFGQRAKQTLGDKVSGKTVRVTWRESDRYGRIVGHVYLDSRWINREMVAEGFAWHYRHYSNNAELE